MSTWTSTLTHLCLFQQLLSATRARTGIRNGNNIIGIIATVVATVYLYDP